MGTPSSAPSSRRASISSVTSSGRRRKDQSLQDVASSLGQRTPERSQPSEEGAPPRSRQLDFGSVDDGDVDDEQTQDEGDNAEADNAQTQEEAQGGDDGKKTAATAAAAVVVEEVKMPVQLLDVDREDEEVPSPESERVDGGAADSRAIRGRRATVFWTIDEEEFLRQGVARHGIGKWKQILIDGAGVFSSHRTNVDLKDKWKNLQTPRQSSRKRRKTPGALTPPAELEQGPVQRPAKRRTASSNSRERPSLVPKPRRRAADVVDRPMTRVAKQNADVEPLSGEVDEENRVENENAGVDERTTSDHGTAESSEPTGSVELKIATDKSFPELVAVEVNLRSCQDVAALKNHLRATVLSEASAYTELQVIGLDSRMLFEDSERLSQCIRKNGTEFFVVLDESPEEFV